MRTLNWFGAVAGLLLASFAGAVTVDAQESHQHGAAAAAVGQQPHEAAAPAIEGQHEAATALPAATHVHGASEQASRMAKPAMKCMDSVTPQPSPEPVAATMDELVLRMKTHSGEVRIAAIVELLSRLVDDESMVREWLLWSDINSLAAQQLDTTRTAARARKRR